MDLKESIRELIKSKKKLVEKFRNDKDLNAMQINGYKVGIEGFVEDLEELLNGGKDVSDKQ